MKTRTLLVCALLSAVTLAVYWPVRHHDFIVFDDPAYVIENRYVQAGLSWPGLKWAFLNFHGEYSYWHPVTSVSHMLDGQLFGLNPGPHHLVNVGFHIVNALLVLALLNRLTGAFWRSATVAALFALHPLQVDTVAWIAERKNVLSTLFGLLTLLAYARYAEVQSPRSKVQSLNAKAQGTPRREDFEPRMEHGLNTDVEGRRQKEECRMQNGGGRNQHPLSTINSPTLNYSLSLLFFACGLMSKPMLVTVPFLLLLLDYWPLQRIAECGMRSAEPGTHHSLTPLLRLVLEKVPFLALAAAAAFITVAVHREVHVDYTSYFPWHARVGNALVSYLRYLGKTFCPSHLSIFYPHPGAWPAWAVAASALVLLATSGWVVWRARRAPYLVVGWLWFLGMLVPVIGIIQAGGQAMADRFAYVPLIGLFVMVVWGLSDWAARWPRGNLALRALSLVALGACAWLTSRQLSYWQNTTTLFEHAVRVTRNNACAHDILGVELAKQGRTREALREWETALEIEPGWGVVHGRIAHLLNQQGDFAGAIARYRQALELEPSLAEALNNLAWLLATCPEASLRDGPEAVRLATKACEVTRFRRVIFVGTLAAAYAETGRFAEAVATAQKACDLASLLKEDALLARNRELMDLYRAGKPYHEPKRQSVATD